MPSGKNRRRVRSHKPREIPPSSSPPLSCPPLRFNSHGELSDIDVADAHACRLDDEWQPCLDDGATILSPPYQVALTADPMQAGRIWRCGRVSVASRPDEAAEQQRRMFGGEDGDESLNHLGTNHDARPTAVESDTIPPSSIPTSFRYSSPALLPTQVSQSDAESSARRLRISHVSFESPFPSALLLLPNCASPSPSSFEQHYCYRHCDELTADEDSVLAAPRPHLGLRP